MFTLSLRRRRITLTPVAVVPREDPSEETPEFSFTAAVINILSAAAVNYEAFTLSVSPSTAPFIFFLIPLKSDDDFQRVTDSGEISLTQSDDTFTPQILHILQTPRSESSVTF